MAHYDLKVFGTKCHSCKVLIEDVLKDLGAQNVEVELKDKSAEVSFDFDGNKKIAISAIESEGYKVI